MKDFDKLTELGRKKLELIKNYGLLKFYQPESGNVLIYPEELSEEVQNKVFVFLKENSQYILGYEESYYFISDN